MAGDIIGERRRDNEGAPFGIRIRGRVVVQVRVSNRGHWPPEAEGIFGVPSTDGGIRHGEVQQREQSRVLFEAIAFEAGDVLGDVIPVARRSLGAGSVRPKQSDL